MSSTGPNNSDPSLALCASGCFSFSCLTTSSVSGNNNNTNNNEARRPDIAYIDKKGREVVIIDVVIPGDDRVKDKELEKLEKYQL